MLKCDLERVSGGMEVVPSSGSRILVAFFATVFWGMGECFNLIDTNYLNVFTVCCLLMFEISYFETILRPVRNKHYLDTNI